MHLAWVTAPAGTAVALLVVLAALGVVLGWCEYRNQVRSLRHDLGMVRKLVACRDLDSAQLRHQRAAARARWLRARLDDTDVMLLGFGPLSLIEPGAPPPRFAVVDRAAGPDRTRLDLRAVDPLDLVATTRMRPVRT